MIYYVQVANNGPVKIGHSTNVKTRFKQIASHLYEEVELVAVTEGHFTDEYALHQKLRPYRLRGEWFRWCPEVEAVVEEAKSRNCIDKLPPGKARYHKTQADLARDVITALGGAKKVSTKLAVDHVTVRGWRWAGVPEDRLPDLARISGGAFTVETLAAALTPVAHQHIA